MNSEYIKYLCVDRFSSLACFFEGMRVNDLFIISEYKEAIYETMYETIPVEKRLLFCVFYKEVLERRLPETQEEFKKLRNEYYNGKCK